MPNTHNVLSQLRDIHLPPAISWWPPAIGWWLVAILLLCALIAVSYYCYYRYQRGYAKRLALANLRQVQVLFQQQHNASQTISEVSKLLKRVALIKHTRQQVAGLKGESWLTFLDQTGNTTQFSQGIGQLLITMPYQQHVTQTIDPIFPLVKQWIEANG